MQTVCVLCTIQKHSSTFVIYYNFSFLRTSVDCGVLAVNLNIQACVGYFLLYVLYVLAQFQNNNF